jgi:hypothetical protein
VETKNYLDVEDLEVYKMLCQSATTSWEYEDGSLKGPWRHALLVIADF